MTPIFFFIYYLPSSSRMVVKSHIILLFNSWVSQQILHLYYLQTLITLDIVCASVITNLHVTLGNEVGGHFLELFVKKFDEVLVLSGKILDPPPPKSVELMY